MVVEVESLRLDPYFFWLDTGKQLTDSQNYWFKNEYEAVSPWIPPSERKFYPLACISEFSRQSHGGCDHSYVLGNVFQLCVTGYGEHSSIVSWLLLSKKHGQWWLRERNLAVGSNGILSWFRYRFWWPWNKFGGIIYGDVCQRILRSISLIRITVLISILVLQFILNVFVFFIFVRMILPTFFILI